MTEIILFVIICGLIGYLFFKEKNQEKIIKEILAFKISKDAFEFKSLTEELPKSRPEEKEKEEIPIEEAPPEKLLEKLRG